MVDDWPDYLDWFHERRAGITERVLGRSFDGGQNPYEWLAGCISDGPVVDVACGSAPLSPLVGEAEYRGFDISQEELRAARKRGASVALAPAERLPLEDGAAGTVVCSMALQVMDGLDSVLAEAARVLRPGGSFVATVPGTGPLRTRDRLLMAGLLGALGRTVSYPNDQELRWASQLFGRAGLTLVGEERRRFAFRLGSAADADLVLESLYLPGISRRRLRAARAWLRGCARLGAEVPVPIRRLIAGR